MKKRVLSLIISILLCFYISLNLVCSLSDVNLRITGVIGDYSSQVNLITNDNAESGIDAYDLQSPGYPDTQSNFYSSISSQSLAVDFWDESERDLNLIYDVPTGQSGYVVFSWNDISSNADYTATFSITGDVTNLDMKSDSDNQYLYPASDDSDIYITINIDNVATTQTITTTTTSGGGGGGGGSAKPETIKLSQEFIDVYSAIDKIKTRQIEVYNSGNDTIIASLSSYGLGNYISFDENNIELKPGERKNINFRILSPKDPGIYTGKILVRGNTIQEILVSLNINTEDLLFDVGISIPESSKIINFGDKISSQITLIPMGEARLDVTLNYAVKDYTGKTLLTESETILVEEQKNFKKDFSSMNLPEGKYILALELIYPNGVATSSSHFEIKSGKTKFDMRFIALALLIAVVILGILIGFAFKKPKYKKKK